MERVWDKKRIIRLNNSDEPTVEQWLDDFIDIIYTWLYYHVGADAAVAADLTGDTFEHAIRELEHFDPDSVTMQQWLREQAKEVRDHGLKLRQIQPQRPWAWSHLPNNILYGISQLRNEPLSDEVTNNPFVREMVQASLAEMEVPNQNLMRWRYNQLQTPEQIAIETGNTIRDINDRLYRCRHFFRRVFVQLIQSANSDFSETSEAGSLELLDANLEKLLSSTNMVQNISPKDRARIREYVLAAASQSPPLKNAGVNKKIIIGISVGIAVLALLGVVFWYIASAPVQETAPPVTQISPPSPTASTNSTPVNSTEPVEEEIDEAQLRRVLDLGQAGDLIGLLEILREGQYTSQRIAARFIGELGDEASIGMLEEAEAKWYPNGPADNPFAKAIIQIEERLLAESEIVIEEPAETQTADANQVQTTEPAVQPQPETPAEEPRITGTVINLSAEPMPNAQITLSLNPLYGNVSNTQIISQVTTNAEGQYRFEVSPTGAFFIDCRSAIDGLAISRSIWSSPEADCRIDFGGKTLVYGVLDGTSEAVSGQVLYLSDTPDPADAAFRTESITDAEGHFSFAGVEPGSYYLLNTTDMNRIVQLDTLQVDLADISSWQVDLQQAVVVIEIEALEADPAVTDVRVIYSPDISEDLAQFDLLLQDDGTYYSDMIPFGSYTLLIQFENGMRLQQPLELNADRTLTITIPTGSSLLTGTFVNPGPYRFFLSNSDQHIRFDLPMGEYNIDGIPPDRYTLSAVVNNLQLEFMEIDLQSEPEMMLDIDAGDLLADLSPLYVVVTDARGAMLSNAQVWVTGTGEVVTTQSTGRGAFLALMPGEYTLYAALPGYSTAEQVIQVQPMPLQTDPNPGNTISLQLKAP